MSKTPLKLVEKRINPDDLIQISKNNYEKMRNNEKVDINGVLLENGHGHNLMEETVDADEIKTPETHFFPKDHVFFDPVKQEEFAKKMLEASKSYVK